MSDEAAELEDAAYDRFLKMAGKRDVDQLEKCLAEGYPCSDPKSDVGGAFEMLARWDWIEGLEVVYRYSKDVDAQNGYGSTPLFMAVRDGSIDTVKWFLDHSANPNVPNQFGYRPLYFAATEAAITGDREMLELLLSRGAVHDVYSLVCLGEFELVRDYLAKHPDAVKQYPNRAGLIGQAVSAWQNRVDHALRHGLPVEDKEHRGLRELLELLIRHGANMNEHEESWSVLHVVAADGASSPHIVKMLLDLGADVNEKTPEGQTPLDLALSVNAPFVDLLRAHGAVSVSPGENGEEIFLRAFEKTREFYEKSKGETEK